MGPPRRSRLIPDPKVMPVSKAGSWGGWAGIRSSCAGLIGACLGMKGGWPVPDGTRGSVFGTLGISWGHDKDRR